MSILLSQGYTSAEDVKTLFSEYTDMMISGDPEFKKYLDKQNYIDELNMLEKKYGFPSGRLYLAHEDDALAGCVGLRKIDSNNCEMKRLYVRPQFRGHKIGTILIKQIIDDAKSIGYKHMLLDTLPFLEQAIKMYKSFGFYEIESYNNSPMSTLVYLKLDL